METCFDPRKEEPHACPGRCACYVNHFCNPGCNCSSCAGTGGCTYAATASLSRFTPEQIAWAKAVRAAR